MRTYTRYIPARPSLRYFYGCLLLLFCAFGNIQTAHAGFVQELPKNWRISVQDDPQIASIDYDTSKLEGIKIPALLKETQYKDYKGNFWMRTVVHVPANARDLGISLGAIMDGYTIYVNGVEIGKQGEEIEARTAAMRSFAYDIPDELLEKGRQKDDIQLTIAVRIWGIYNHMNAFPGGTGMTENGAYLLGDKDIVRARSNESYYQILVENMVSRFVTWAMLVLAGAYSILLYSRRKSLKEYLWFGLFGVFMGESQIFWSMRDLGILSDYWDIFRFLGRATFYYGAASFIFFSLYFIGRVPKIWDWFVYYGMIFCAVLQAFVPSVYWVSIWISRPLMLSGAIMAVVYIFLGVYRKVPDSKILAFGMFCFSTCAFVLVFDGFGVPFPFTPAEYAPYAIFGMMLSIGAALLARFARAYNELDEKNIELMRMDKLKDEFLANTSHELRTPLNGIIGIAESLLDGVAGPMTPKMRSNLEMVAQSGKRLSSLVNDILDFSKLKHKTIDLRRKSVDMHALVDVVLALSGPLVGKKELQLINQVPSNLPAAYADEDRLQQILHNIIGNAIKFTHTGSVTVTAKVTAKNGQNPPEMIVSVMDTGIGIKPEAQSRIFASFEQADGSTEREYGGTGLGLAVTKQLVELHQGRIFVESVFGQGTTMSFTLPLEQNTQASTQASTQADSPKLESSNTNINTSTNTSTNKNTPTISTTIPALKEIEDETSSKENPFRILVIDDEPVNLQVLENHLSLHRFTVYKASDGFSAIELLKDLQNKHQLPDLILSDVMMPRMSGYELTRRIRALLPDLPIPVMLLTAKNREDDVLDGFDAGASDYIVKPFSRKELIARLRTHLRLSKMDASARRFVPFEFLELLGKESLVDIQRGDHIQKNMTVLFSDIRSFTTLSERLSPEQNFQFINRYLATMEPAIHGHSGFVNQYLGDGIMALFHRPEIGADDAVQAAIGMHKALRVFNSDPLNIAQNINIDIGIGLNTGKLMLGTIGGSDRMDCGVISDSVNLAARMEGMTKMYRAKLMLSEGTYNALPDPKKYQIRQVDRVIAKGKQIPIAIYEVLDADIPDIAAQKQASMEQFLDGLSAYRAGQFTQALAAFQSCLAICPTDGASLLYKTRCETWIQEMKNGKLEGFDGITRLDQK